MKKLSVLIYALLLIPLLGMAQDRGPKDGPSNATIERYLPGNNSIPENPDFTVWVAPTGTNDYGDPLYSYTTYVNKVGYFDSTPETQDVDGNFQASSFVNFDFAGSIDIFITCNYCDELTADDILIRPQSKGITPNYVNGNKFRFTLSNPANLSVEVNGDRYRNIHIFANPPAPPPPTEPYISAQDIEDYMSRPENQHKVYFNPKHYNDTIRRIHLEGNEVVQYGISFYNTEGIYPGDGFSITGRGIINQSHREKNYIFLDSTHTVPAKDLSRGIWMVNANNITVDGIIINDPGHNCIKLESVSNVHFNNVKTISRVIWGAGIRMDRVDSIKVDNSFFRTTDDSVAIFSKPDCFHCEPEDQNSWDIDIKNTSLYADKAHPIAIGWDGTRKDSLAYYPQVEKIRFENIDILEQEESNQYYQGVIGIHCGENNNCMNISFKNVRVEPFTDGSFLSLIVEPPHNVEVREDGYRIQNILLDSIQFNSNPGHTLGQSDIKGIQNNIYKKNIVNGVHFKNIKINDSSINNLSQLKNHIYVENDTDTITAFDITVQEDREYIDDLSGLYYIKHQLPNQAMEYVNLSSSYMPGGFLKKYTRSAPWSSKWKFEKVVGTNDLYKIESAYESGQFLTGTMTPHTDLTEDHGNYVATQGDGLPFSEPESNYWRVIELPNRSCRLINVWKGHSSLTHSSVDMPGSSHEYITLAPWMNIPRQQWILEPAGGSLGPEQLIPLEAVFPVPNQADTFFELDFSGQQADVFKVRLFDIYANLRFEEETTENRLKVDTRTLEEGIYFLHIADGQQTIKKKVIVKH